MKTIRTNRVLAQRLCFATAIALGLLGSASPCSAVQITGNTYAAENGGPTTNPSAKSYNLVDPISVSANIRSDVGYSHAQSWASASVNPDGSGITKTTGGRAWGDNPPTSFSARSNLWNASATGTKIVANYKPSGSQSGSPTFNFSLPKSIAKTADPFYNTAAIQSNLNYNQPGNDPSSTANPSSMLLPVSGASGSEIVSQGVITNGALPQSFDVFVDVDAFVQGGPALFQGGYEFNPNTGVYAPYGDFPAANSSDVFISPRNSNDPNAPEFSLTFLKDIAGASYVAATGVPFDVKINLDATMGNRNKQDLTASGFTGTTYDLTGTGLPNHGNVTGAGSEVTANFLVQNTQDFFVSPVPEPSTLGLATCAAFGLMLAARRRK